MGHQLSIENSTHNSTTPWKRNQDYWSSFELYPEWSSNEFYVFKGIAHHRRDYWTGTMVAVKTFRNQPGTVEGWNGYKRRCDTARKLSANFNEYLNSNSIDTRIHVLKPTDAKMEKISFIMKFTRFLMNYDKTFVDQEVVLFEDLLEGEFKYFVTCTGSATSKGCDILDAFCHYCYHTSGGRIVLCNLKGIIDEGRYILSNPTIHSVDRYYGNKDKGQSGIDMFFDKHICNALCEDFLSPANYCPDSTLSKVSHSEESFNIYGFDSPPQYSSIYPNGPPSRLGHDANS